MKEIIISDFKSDALREHLLALYNCFKGGGFILISGSAAFISIGDKKAMVTLPDFNWQGVIIAYRMPRPAHPVDILPFVE